MQGEAGRGADGKRVEDACVFNMWTLAGIGIAVPGEEKLPTSQMHISNPRMSH